MLAPWFKPTVPTTGRFASASGLVIVGKFESIETCNEPLPDVATIKSGVIRPRSCKSAGMVNCANAVLTASPKAGYGAVNRRYVVKETCALGEKPKLILRASTSTLA